jgi:predicted RNase H-like HicB family nuclease
MEIQFTTRVFTEGGTFIAHALELDVSSCGSSAKKAVQNLKEAVRLFLEACGKMGTLAQVLEEAGYTKSGREFRGPKIVSMQQISLPLPLTHAKA